MIGFLGCLLLPFHLLIKILNFSRLFIWIARLIKLILILSWKLFIGFFHRLIVALLVGSSNLLFSALLVDSSDLLFSAPLVANSNLFFSATGIFFFSCFCIALLVGNSNLLFSAVRVIPCSLLLFWKVFPVSWLRIKFLFCVLHVL